MRRLAVVLILVAVLAGGGWAAEPVTLRLRFTPEEQTTYKVSITGAGISRIMNQSQPLQVTGELLLKQKTLAVDPQGNGQLETTAAGAKLAFTVRGQDRLQTVPSQPVRETVSPRGELLTPKGAEGPPSGFNWSGLPGLGKLLGSVQFPLLPERAVSAGQEWSDQLPLEVGGREVMVEQKSKLESFTQVEGRDCAQIQSRFTLPVEVLTPPNPLGMTETIKGTERVSRTTLFDPETGRIVRQETSLISLLEVQITVPAEAGKQVIPGSLELRMKIEAAAQP